MTILEAIRERHSVRAYKEIPIEEELRVQMDALVEQANEESGLNIQIIYDDPTGFDARLAHYGKFSNVSNYIVLKGAPSQDFEERCGYYGEMLVLEAQRLGLNTCWVAMTFNKKSVKKLVPKGEKLCMVIALGYGENQGQPRTSKLMKDVLATQGAMPGWFADGVNAALLAPTATNQQKFKIGMVDGEPAIRVSGVGFCTKTDLGIVKYHFEVASGRKVK